MEGKEWGRERHLRVRNSNNGGTSGLDLNGGSHMFSRTKVKAISMVNHLLNSETNSS